MITEDILDSQCITNEDNYGRVAIEAREVGISSTQTIEWKVSLDSWPITRREDTYNDWYYRIGKCK
jgi:hypothetical protein